MAIIQSNSAGIFKAAITVNPLQKPIIVGVKSENKLKEVNTSSTDHELEIFTIMLITPGADKIHVLDEESDEYIERKQQKPERSHKHLTTNLFYLGDELYGGDIKFINILNNN